MPAADGTRGAPAPAGVSAPEADDAGVPGTPPGLAQLEGIALLRAVFPGRLVRVERGPAGTEGDAVAATDATDDADRRPEPGPTDDLD